MTQYNSTLEGIYQEWGLMLAVFGFLLLLLAFYHWQ